MKELEAAKGLIKVNGIYSHYKNQHRYRVIAVGTQEATDKLCVVYQELDGDDLVFVRDLDVWLEQPGNGTPRFKFVSES